LGSVKPGAVPASLAPPRFEPAVSRALVSAQASRVSSAQASRWPLTARVSPASQAQQVSRVALTRTASPASKA
jgi:hypothetical protein